MANRLQLKRGTGAPGNIFYEGEPIFDLGDKSLYVGDSEASGAGAGTSIASAETFLASLQILTRATTDTAGAVNLYEDVDNGTNKVQLIAPSTLSGDVILTLPSTDGTLGDLLTSDGEGNLSFATPFTIDADSGTADSVLVGDTITFEGGEGIDTLVSSNKITIAGQAASSTNAGIASYQASQFYFEDTYTVGVVTATDTVKGIASFNSDFFTVNNGEVSVNTTISGIVTSVEGTANEIVTSTNEGTVTVGLSTNVVISNDLTVNGNLRVVGTAVTFEAQTVRIEDRLLELGLVNNQEPTQATTWDTGLVFNWHDGDNAKKSAIFWLDNEFIAAASDITENSSTGNADPQVSVTAYAPIVSAGLYVGGITAGDEVINSSKEAVNLVFDGGTYI
jgi:hypothetical protein